MRTSRLKSANQILRILGGAAIAASLLVGCGDDDDSPIPPEPFDASATLENVALNVILATYVDLETNAAQLKTACDTLQANPTEDNLAAAREAWRDARRPWEQSEGFLFGPVDTEGLDPAIDSWPVNVIDLDAVLASSDELTPEFIDGLEGTLKGFHTIEYLLFGVTGDRSAASLTAREKEYLAATTESLRRSTARLADTWRPTEGNFAAQIIGAGQSGSVYVSQKAALQEFVSGLITITDEVGNGKINDPYAEQDSTLEESRFSANSIVDFQDNIRSVRNIYKGEYGAVDGPGLTEIIAARDAALDARIHAEIEAAIDAIGAIPAPFSRAIFEDGPAVEAAQTAVRTLQETVQGALAAAIEAL